MLKAVRILLIWLSFSFLQACSEATPDVTDLTQSSTGSLTAILNSAPTGFSNSSLFAVLVSGTGVIEYKYKFGASSVNCADPVGYSSAVSVAVTLADYFGGFTDQNMKLCVIGGDGLLWQDSSVATVATWYKDTTPASVSLTSAVAAISKESSVYFLVTFSEGAAGFTAADITVSNGTVTGLNSLTSATYEFYVVPTTDGPVSVSIPASTSIDRANNGNLASNSISWTYDGTAPQLQSVTSSKTNGGYSAGAVIDIRLIYDENVSVDTTNGVPYVWVETGATDRQAEYVSGSGTTTVVLTFTVSAADYNTDLDLISSAQLFSNGGVVSDAVGNIVSTTLPTGSATNSLKTNKALVIIGTVPVLTISDLNYNFGSVTAGGKAEKTFTLTNNSSYAALSISTSSLPSGYAWKGGAFPGTGGSCFVGGLAASASCTAIVEFSPAVAGTFSGNITVNYTNGISAQAVNNAISGTGTNPAVLSISEADPYSYGLIAAMGTSTHNFTVSNSGGTTATGINETDLGGNYIFSGGYPGTGGTCSTTLIAGGSCTLAVMFAPTAVQNNITGQINLQYNNGAIVTSTIRTLLGYGIAEVKPVYGTNLTDSSAAWGRYVRYDNDAGGTNQYNQDIEMCDGTEAGKYNEFGGCIHSGEKRKVIFYGRNSCLNLTATDSLAAFDWVCDASSGTAIFYSRGLKQGKGLRDLMQTFPTVELATSAVELYDNGSFVGTTASSYWWSNTAAPVTSQAAGTTITLGTPETIYYTSGSVSADRFMISGPAISFVSFSEITNNGSGLSNWCNSTLGGTSGADSDPLFCSDSGASAPKFSWIEVDFTGAGNKRAGFSAVGWRSVRLNNVHIRSLNSTSASYAGAALYMNDVIGSYISGFEVFRATAGLTMVASSLNTFRDLNLTRAGSNAATPILWVRQTSYLNNFYNTTVAGNASTGSNTYGVLVDGANNIFSKLHISNTQATASAGLVVSQYGHDNIFTELMVTSIETGIWLSQTSSNLFSFVTIAQGTSAGIYLDGTGATLSGNTFNSLAAVNNWAGVITNITGTAGVVNRFENSAISTLSTPIGSGNILNASGGGLYLRFNGFFVRNSDDACIGTSSNLNTSCVATGTTNIPISFTPWENTFVGLVSTNDVLNPYDSNGSAMESSINMAFGWLGFDSYFRAWGRDGFFGTGTRGYVAQGSTTARIWDYTPKASSPIYRRGYDGTISAVAIVYDGNPCVAGTVDATKISHTLNTGTVNFVKNAIEINYDSKGNNNGLCEDNEDCTFAPHIGGAQGEGGTTAGFCTMSGGIRIFGRTI